MGAVNIRSVTKKFGAHVILHDVSLDVADGEFLVLVGPSGCGKTTLLRMIAGLEEITAGDVSINGTNVKAQPPRDRDVAMVFQNYALYPHMNVAENINFSLRVKKLDNVVVEAKTKAVARILGLSDLLARYPKQLSGGQRQRVAMGRAIIREPQVFLFDEPLSNLDAKLRVQMRAEMKQLHQRLGTTTIYVTHDQVEAMTLADRMVVMNHGRIEQIGSPLEVYDGPANEFVAAFIGSPTMNFISGRVVGGGFVSETGLRMELSRPGLGDERVSLGVRPEDFVLDPDGWPLKVDVVEPTGSETHISGTCSGHAVLVVARERLEVSPGEEIGVRPDPKKVHLFSADTGLRLS